MFIRKWVGKQNRSIDFESFFLAGGQLTLADWKQLTDEQRAEAVRKWQQLKDFERLIQRYQNAQILEEKLAIAESLAQYDGGELARQLRIMMNQEALQ